MNYKNLTKPDNPYFGEQDFVAAGEVKVVTIASYAVEEVQNQSGKRKKGVLRFKEGVKPLILNVTNGKAIAQMYGKDADGWIGKKIALYYKEDVTFGKQVVGGTRVKAPPATAAAPICQSCGNPIQPAGKMTAEQTAAYTAKKYGQALCGGCATQAAKALQEAQGGSQDATDE